MIDQCQACPTLWPVRSDGPQISRVIPGTGSFDAPNNQAFYLCPVPKTWWVIFQKAYISLLQMARPCFRTQRSALPFSYRDLLYISCASFSTTDTADTRGPVRLHDLHGQIACTMAWTHCRALSYLGPPTKLMAFCVTTYKGPSSIPRCGMCCL